MSITGRKQAFGLFAVAVFACDFCVSFFHRAQNFKFLTTFFAFVFVNRHIFLQNPIVLPSDSTGKKFCMQVQARLSTVLDFSTNAQIIRIGMGKIPRILKEQFKIRWGENINAYHKNLLVPIIDWHIY
jgi:hypothetical protein